MCFAPEISLLTAVVEWILVAIILLKFRKSIVARFSASLIFVLGLYQLTEFMLCKTAHPALWAQIGFITYTFLPAMGLYFTLRLIGNENKFRLWLCYLPPVIFSLLSLISSGFVVGSTCNRFFVSNQLMFFSPEAHHIIMSVYLIYYFGFIVISSILAYEEGSAQKEILRKKILFIFLAGVWLATLPALLFIVILPEFKVQFPSLYCEFALLVAIAGFVVAELDAKHRVYKK